MIETAPLEVDDWAPDARLTDQNGDTVALAHLWMRQPTAFVFLRHFGCMHCRAQAVQLRRDRLKFSRAELGVVLIGLGDTAQAAAFRAEFDLPFTILTDPTKQAYRAYGLIHRVNVLREVTDPEEVVKSIARTARFGAMLTRQDMRQLGGVFVVNRTGKVRYAYRSLRAADYPSATTILGALTT